MSSIVLGYDLIGCNGEIPNCLPTNFFETIRVGSDWKFDESGKYWMSKHDFSWPVYNSGYFDHLDVVKQNIFDIVKNRKQNKGSKWFYPIEPFGDLYGLFGQKDYTENPLYENISKIALNEIKKQSKKW